MRFATRLMESASATEDPPNFWTTRLMGRFPSRLRTGGVERAGPPRTGVRRSGPGRSCGRQFLKLERYRGAAWSTAPRSGPPTRPTRLRAPCSGAPAAVKSTKMPGPGHSDPGIRDRPPGHRSEERRVGKENEIEESGDR